MPAFPLTMPATPKPVKARFGLVRNQAISRDPYSRKPKILHRQGDGWRIDFELPPMALADAAEWIAFKAALEGLVGTFKAGDPRRTSPRGTAQGTPLVDGASQTGTTLNTKGWTASQTGVLKKYDYIEVESRLYMVVEDANAGGTGLASLAIEPALRTSPANNAAVTVSNPRGVFRLADADQVWDEDLLLWEGLAFSAEDALT